MTDVCYKYKEMLIKTTAPQTNDCKFNSWLYLDFECRQTSAFSTVKTFAVYVWKEPLREVFCKNGQIAE